MGTKFYQAKQIEISKTSRIETGKFILIFSFLLIAFFSGYTQTALSFTQIPTSNPDFIAPDRGAEHWGTTDWDNVYVPEVPAGNTKPLNFYTRFNWTDIESSTSQGSYSWSTFDAAINQAIDDGAMFSFGVMPMCTACGSFGAYPTYLHNLMQAEASNSRDWQNSDGVWVPNWNSPNWLGRWTALMNAVAAHISTGTHSGKNYKDAVYIVDIRGYGDFGEWHTYPWTGTEPTGRAATVASLQAIVDAVKNAFPNNPLVLAMGAFDTQNASQLPAQACYYNLTTKNNWGEIGWRRDNLGDDGYNSWLTGNPGTYNGVSFSTLIMNKWKVAPIGGEPANDLNGTSRCGSIQCDLLNEINLFHMSSFGNGNFPIMSNTSTALVNAVLAASKASGYRLVLTGGTMTTTLASGGAFSLSLNWQNVGIAPVYENWNVVYELRKSDGTVVWTGNSAFKPKLFLPAGTPTAASDNFTLSAVAAGTYSMYMIVRDPASYKAPLPLAINGRNTDGSYLIRSNITIGTGPADQAPTANGGANQTIQLPTSTTSFTGTGTDADGTISSYAWSKLSGPAGGTVSSPATANTSITGLVQGVYQYVLTVTDNQGVTGKDTIQVTVNAAAPVNQPPVARAGADLSITLPTSSAILNGSASSDPDGSITTYLWTKISGPSQFTIGNSAAASTVANNLTAGVYSFQLKVTDNSGATALDTINITVNAAPVNQPPVANAGSDITITLPTNLTNLTGTASTDPDGTITTYLWSQVSGPSTATITSPANVSTGISGLAIGVYVFSLRVTDNGGATNLDSVKVTVNPAANIPPVANAGISKSINLPVSSTTLDGTLSTDADGTITAYSWAQISGPSTAVIIAGNTATATASTLLAGQYTFELTVTDNSGATAKAQVKITVVPIPVGPLPPVANAGADQTITLPTNSVTINGSASTAPSGNIVSYAWAEKSGPSSVGLSGAAQNTLSNLVAGKYVFSLTVTDNNGGTGTDSVVITVIPAANIAPIANAGASITLTSPTTSTSLDGTKSSDPDGTISSYSWTEISGPNTPPITGANTATPGLSGLIVGQYTYQLTVTDNNGATSSAQVKIKVAAAANVPPVANAGIDQTITSPANSVILDGSASYDPDGTITSYSWVTVSGPGTITINNSNTASPSAVGLQIGQYIFELTVTDNIGATAKDQVTVNVLPQSVLPNQAPVANAGTNQTITAPTSSINLNGSSSFDPDGTLTGFVWVQLSGPSTAVVTGGNTSTPAVSQLVPGQYVFQLTVTDNNGATNNDAVTITVNAATAKVANELPVADAGPSDTVFMPISSVVLNASGSTDPDGTIANYQWQQIGGPNTVNSTSMNNAQVTVSNLQAGTYQFQVTVTDNSGATAQATSTLVVVQGFTRSVDQFVLFPNPANGVIHGKITSTVDGSVKMYIYDMNGKLVYSTQVQKSDDIAYKTMNIAGLAPGMYTVQINIANRKTMVAKFIKN
jgi:hypothetical protein